MAMQSMRKYIESYQIQDPKAPKHEKAAMVVEILKIVPETKQYNFGYWLKKIGSVRYGTLMGILKNAHNLDKKYNKGGYITNRLREYNATATKK